MLDRIYLKRTRRGNFLKIVREHYLRDDLSCGSETCENQVCRTQSEPSQGSAQSKQKLILESIPVSISSLFPFSHYLVPDTNIILHQVRIVLDFKNLKFFFINNKKKSSFLQRWM